MTKRIAVCLLLTLCLAAGAAAETRHVQTPNGKPLNVRGEASQKGDMTVTLHDGSAGEDVQVLQNNELGYALVYDDHLFRLEQSDGMDTYWWNSQAEGMPNCYLNVSRLTGYTLEEAVDGLVLQSGMDGERSAMTLNGQEAFSYTFSEGTQEDDRVVQYVCVTQSDASILLIELACYAGVRDTVEPYLQEMLLSITLSAPSANPAPSGGAAATDYVRCDVCGEWFEAGNEFRNHQCVTYPGEDYAK